MLKTLSQHHLFSLMYNFSTKYFCWTEFIGFIGNFLQMKANFFCLPFTYHLIRQNLVILSSTKRCRFSSKLLLTVFHSFERPKKLKTSNQIAFLRKNEVYIILSIACTRAIGWSRKNYCLAKTCRCHILYVSIDNDKNQISLKKDTPNTNIIRLS